MTEILFVPIMRLLDPIPSRNFPMDIVRNNVEENINNENA